MLYTDVYVCVRSLCLVIVGEVQVSQRLRHGAAARHDARVLRCSRVIGECQWVSECVWASETQRK